MVAMFVMLAIVPAHVIAAIPLAAPAWMLMLVAVPNPLLLHKIHRLATGVVVHAMFAPVLLMARRHVKINRLAHNGNGLLNDDHRLRIDQHGLRIIADVDTPVNAGLVDPDRHAHVGLGHRRSADQSACDQKE